MRKLVILTTLMAFFVVSSFTPVAAAEWTQPESPSITAQTAADETCEPTESVSFASFGEEALSVEDCPRISVGWAYYVRFSRTEVRNIAANYNTSWLIANAACLRIGIVALTAACVVYVNVYAISLASTFKTAKKYNQCVELRFTTGFPPQLYYKRRYSTNPTCHTR